MNKINKFFTVFILLLIGLSCNEEEFLKEEPLDFYSPENSFTKPSDFESALSRIYSNVQSQFHNGASLGMCYFFPSDCNLDNHGIEHHLNSYTNSLIPENGWVSQMWNRTYRTIFDCNVLISRIVETEAFANENDRITIQAEAQFIRGFMYKFASILWGGVPIVLEEISAPKRDFVRASREEVWAQVVSDLTFAAQNLPTQTELKEDGHATKGAAQHVLAEMYIIMEDWDKAIATAVIDNPDYALMTERFGTWADRPGDVYGDLFRRGNKNYWGQAGTNTEAIWVSQFEYQTPGGEQANYMTRFAGSVYWSLVGNDGVNLFFGHSSQHGGRGIGWLNPTDYLLHEIWTDPDDIRNSEYNIIRDVKADNPESAYYGQYIVESGAFTEFDNALNRWWHAIWAKTAPINDFPAEVIANPETGATTNGANQTFNDTYYFRLAETYLLRAEAYFGKGDLINAAADINTVRARAKAAPVNPGDVDIDYILDERARELHYEEFRVLTLMRLGKQKERVDQHNVMSGGHIEDKHKVWPIPQSEIERNTEAELEQNPGYN